MLQLKLWSRGRAKGQLGSKADGAASDDSHLANHTGLLQLQVQALPRGRLSCMTLILDLSDIVQWHAAKIPPRECP